MKNFCIVTLLLRSKTSSLSFLPWTVPSLINFLQYYDFYTLLELKQIWIYRCRVAIVSWGCWTNGYVITHNMGPPSSCPCRSLPSSYPLLLSSLSPGQRPPVRTNPFGMDSLNVLCKSSVYCLIGASVSCPCLPLRMTPHQLSFEYQRVELSVHGQHLTSCKMLSE